MPLHFLWHTLKAHLLPKVIAEAESPLNGHIEVVEVMGNCRIMVGGYVQSGGFVDVLWYKSLQRLKRQKKGFTPNRAAMFGFAGGSAARALRKLWKDISITAVDIDPVIVDLGKKYFHTDLIPHLTLQVASVFDWIKGADETYDIIIIDLFKGGKIPGEASTSHFINHLYRILSSSGVVLVNYFPHESNRDDLSAFDAAVRKTFPHVSVYELLAEKMYLLSK